MKLTTTISAGLMLLFNSVPLRAATALGVYANFLSSSEKEKIKQHQIDFDGQIRAKVQQAKTQAASLTPEERSKRKEELTAEIQKMVRDDREQQRKKYGLPDPNNVSPVLRDQLRALDLERKARINVLITSARADANKLTVNERKSRREKLEQDIKQLNSSYREKARSLLRKAAQ